MKTNRLQIVLTASILGFFLCLGSLGCFVTGYSMPIASPVESILVLAGLSIAFPAILVWRRGGTAILCLIALVTGFFWRFSPPRQQLFAMLGEVLGRYSSAYGIPVPSLFQGRTLYACDLPLLYYGMVLLAACAWGLCRKNGTLPAIALAVLPLSLCLVITDAVPSRIFLLLLLFSAGIMAFTASARRESLPQANRLARLLALPLAGALGLLTLLIPQEGYINRAEAGREWMLSQMQPLSASVSNQLTDYVSGAKVPSAPLSTVNLAALNGQPRTGRLSMYVTSDKPGAIYLRFQDYDQYTGIGWYANRARQEVLFGEGDISNHITLDTILTRGYRYLPYYPSAAETLEGGSQVNGQREQTYSFDLTDTPGQTSLSQEERSRYLALPEAAQAGAARILNTLAPDPSSAEVTAEKIRRYVSQSAAYDRQTPPMAQDASDFALWFLEESDTGFCVHFATASVVLLRGCGIPARYVTGYLAYGDPGAAAPVTEDQAHAWAEYYDDSRSCWVLLDATPAEGLPTPGTQTATETTRATTLPVEDSGEADSSFTPAATLPKVPEEAPIEAEASSISWEIPLAILGGILLLALLIFSQRLLRVKLHNRHLKTSDNRHQAVSLWQDILLLSRRAGLTPPEELASLVEKAVYSPHPVTSRELLLLREYRKECITALKAAPTLRQWVDKWILALY